MRELREQLIEAGAEALYDDAWAEMSDTQRIGAQARVAVILDAFLDVLEAVRPTSTHTIALLAVARGPRVADPIGEVS